MRKASGSSRPSTPTTVVAVIASFGSRRSVRADFLSQGGVHTGSVCGSSPVLAGQVAGDDAPQDDFVFNDQHSAIGLNRCAHGIPRYP